MQGSVLKATAVLGVSFVSCVLVASPASAFEMHLPVQCGDDTPCFVQNYPDMESGSDVADPFCGKAAYGTHRGTDFRLVSMEDAERNVPVLAVAEGRVLRVRDGEEDRLVLTDAERESVSGSECGNGVVIDHGGGWETQYCHLKRGSISVTEGDRVAVGTELGAIGASGLTQFPHVHLSVRKDGVDTDPYTGRALTDGCDPDLAATEALWSDAARKALPDERTQLLASGLAGEVVDHTSLVAELPATASLGDPVTVGWVKLINLRQSDRVALEVFDINGALLADQISDPMPRHRATQSLYAGRRISPVPGDYDVRVRVLREGRAVIDERKTILVTR